MSSAGSQLFIVDSSDADWKVRSYPKSDCADLTHDEYKLLVNEAETILAQPLLHDWT